MVEVDPHYHGSAQTLRSDFCSCESKLKLCEAPTLVGGDWDTSACTLARV